MKWFTLVLGPCTLLSCMRKYVFDVAFYLQVVHCRKYFASCELWNITYLKCEHVNADLNKTAIPLPVFLQ